MSEAPERFKFSLGRFFLWLTIVCAIIASGRSRRISEVRNFSLSFILICTVLGVLVAWVGINVIRPLLTGQEFLAMPRSQRMEWIVLCVAIAMWLAPFAYQFLISD